MRRWLQIATIDVYFPFIFYCYYRNLISILFILLWRTTTLTSAIPLITLFEPTEAQTRNRGLEITLNENWLLWFYRLCVRSYTWAHSLNHWNCNLDWLVDWLTSWLALLFVRSSFVVVVRIWNRESFHSRFLSRCVYFSFFSLLAKLCFFFINYRPSNNETYHYSFKMIFLVWNFPSYFSKIPRFQDLSLSFFSSSLNEWPPNELTKGLNVFYFP